MRLDRKTIVVTGGAGGIGLACARRYATGGARVLIADLDESAGRLAVEALRSEGANARFERVDVTRAADAQRLIKAAVVWGGRLDGLHNSAGGPCGVIKPVTETREDDWDRVIAVNLKVFTCAATSTCSR